jgi:programmed cell death protein 4
LFFFEEVRDKGWEIFNNLFIRKAIDIAMDMGGNEKEGCQRLLFKCTHKYEFGNMDYGYAFDYLIWNNQEYKVDIPQFAKLLSTFIARAIYDGAVTYKYLSDAEVSKYGDEGAQ